MNGCGAVNSDSPTTAPTSSMIDVVADSRCRIIDVERYRAEVRERKQRVRCIYERTEMITRDRETRTASGCTMEPAVAPEFTGDEGVGRGSDAVEEGSVETGMVALGDIDVVKPDDVPVEDRDGEGDGEEDTEGVVEGADADADGVADVAAADEEGLDADVCVELCLRVELAPTVMVNIVVLWVEDAVDSISEGGTGMGLVAAGRGVSNDPDMPTSLKLADHAVKGAVPLSFFRVAEAIAMKYLSESGPAAALGINVIDLLVLTSTGEMLCTSFYFASSTSVRSSR